MQPQFIPNGTLVAFNRGNSFAGYVDEALCEIIEDVSDDYDEPNTVYLLKCDESVSEETRHDLAVEEDGSFRCHVAYFELADIPVDVPDISSLL